MMIPNRWDVVVIGGGPAETMAAEAPIQFERTLEQELMYIVSAVTTRSQNYLETAKIKDGRIITSDKFRVLEEIAF